jgi:hypothetical protein
MEENRANICKALSGKTIYSALYGSYTVTLNELKDLLKASITVKSGTTGPTPQDDGFQEVRRRKRHNTQEAAKTPKKAAIQSTPQPEITSPKEVATRNFYAPMRTTEMDTDAANTEASPQEAPAPKTGRPPPIILTSTNNLIHLQKQLKNVVKDDFEFRSTRNGTRDVTRGMVDLQTIKSHLEENNLSFFTFYPKAENPIKAVIRYLPQNTPVSDICDGLVSLGFDVISVKLMTTTRLTPSKEPKSLNLPLFLVTLPRWAKSQEIFRLQSLCHNAIKVEAYRAQNAPTQCHNCQQFAQIWANCKQPSRCLCCGGGHLHKECPEEENAASTPECCNCKLLEDEKPHPANYRGCRHAKEELQRRKL